MKKVLFLALFFAFASSVNAQEYRKIEVEPSLGYALASGGVSGGISFGLEGRYNINSTYSAGIGWYNALTGVETGTLVTLAATRAILLTGDYNFKAGSKFRPFAGLGIGSYSTASATASITASGTTTNLNIGGKSGLGIAPRVGFELSGTLRMGLTYHLPFGDVSENKHLSITLGVAFGGGEK